MSAAPEARGPLSLRRVATDSPAAILTLVFVGIFVGTDIINRAQGGGAFLTLRQVSTTFLFAAVLGLMSAGQTLVMLTGGVDLSVATGGTLARRIIKEKRPKAIIAVACERDLTSGIVDSYPLPVIGILNQRPFGPCINTRVDMKDVQEALEYFTGLKAEVECKPAEPVTSNV